MNAIWLARQLEEWREADPAAPAVSSRDIRQAGIPLDRLAGKAIDNIEFHRLWLEISNGHVVSDPFEDLSEETAGCESEIATAGILSGLEICRRLDSPEDSDSRLVLTPLLPQSIREAGIDVRLARQFITFKHSSTPAFDALEDRLPRTMHQVVEKAWGDSFVLHPGELVLAATMEYLVMPPDLVAQVVTRSSYGRLGLITATAIQVQPFSRGCITLELVNEGEMPLILSPGQRIAQLIFHSILCPIPRAFPHKYEYPTGPEFSKVRQDRDSRVLRGIRRRYQDIGR